MSDDTRMIRREMLDVVGTMFGLTFDGVDPRTGAEDQVTLWLEDDEIFYSVATFHSDWIGDLHKVMWGAMQEWAKRKVSGRKS